MKGENFITEISLDDFIKQGRKEGKRNTGKGKPGRRDSKTQKPKKQSVSKSGGNKKQAPKKSQKRSSQKTSKLEVTNIALKVTNKELFDMFAKSGELIKCKLITDDIGRSKGVAIIKYEQAESATKAFKLLNGKKVKGKELEINFKMSGGQNQKDSNRTKKIKKGRSRNDKKHDGRRRGRKQSR